MHLALSLAFLASLNLAPPPAASGHEEHAPVARPAEARADSQRVARAARRAQDDFERTRRARLPQVDEGGADRCEERIGFWCYWYDGDIDPHYPDEPDAIKRARAELLYALAQAADSLPGDTWIAGQRVRYLVESERPAEAVAVARSCTAGGWWCNALEGYALDAARDYAAADSAFSAALRAMSADERCRWTDLSLLLDGDLGSRYDRMNCAARDSINATVWWLADPLFSVPGNDLRTEHFSRLTLARLSENTPSPYGGSWHDPMREISVRYGWPVRWARRRALTPSLSAEPQVIGYDRTPSYDFFPSLHAVQAPPSASSDDWSLDGARPRTRYAPEYATVFVGLEHQASAFRRGDSAIVVAAYDVSADTGFRSDSITAALALARDAMTEPVIRSLHAAAGVLVDTAAWRPAVLSVEVIAAPHRAARARYGVGAADSSGAGRVSVSDLLLFTPGPEVPASLGEAAPRARSSPRTRSAERLGLFWETYGLRPGETVKVAVTILPRRHGLRAVTDALRLSRRPSPTNLQWEETAAVAHGIAPRAVALELSTLSPGQYVVTIDVEAAGEPAVHAARQIEVTRP